MIAVLYCIYIYTQNLATNEELLGRQRTRSGSNTTGKISIVTAGGQVSNDRPE